VRLDLRAPGASARAAAAAAALTAPLRGLLGAVAPPLCAACGATAGGAEPLCLRCRRGLRWLGDDPLTIHGIACWAPVAYEGPARSLVGALKFRGAASAATVMAAQIVANAPPPMLRAGCRHLLVPVPIHPRRLRRRGYNQAELLAQELQDRTGVPVAAVLERSGDARAQVGRGRAARLTGPPGSVRLLAGQVAPAHVLLVDDVITTGGTLAACARYLLARGSLSVRAIAYARTLGR
jgi:ComF family protein